MRPQLLLALLWPCLSQGQAWFSDQAVWHYTFNGGAGFNADGHVRVEVTGDSLVAGQPSRMLTRTRETYDYDLAQYSSLLIGTIFAHEMGGIVWVYMPSLNAFDTLYAMNAVPGDHWQLPALPDAACDPESRMEVTDTGMTVIAGQVLRWLAVDITLLPFAQTISDTIIERIGTIGTYLLPMDVCAGFLDFEEGGPLRCFQDAGIFYTTEIAPACDFIVGVSGQSAPTNLVLFPNPAQDQLHVQLPKGVEGGLLRVLGATGRVLQVERFPAFVSTFSFPISDLPPGLYALELMDQQSVRWLAKWVKE